MLEVPDWRCRLHAGFGRGLLWLLLALLGSAELCEAAPPQLTTLIPRGWKVGPNEVTLQGANLTEATQLLLDLPGVGIVLKPETKPAPNQLQFVVTIPPETLPGLYEARVAGPDGVSGALVWMLDQFPNVAEGEPNNSLPQAQAITVPAAVEGRLAGVESDVFAIDGKQGERLVVEIAGRRLGCNLKPVLKLFNASRLELAAARGQRSFGGDARLTATLPADGRYYLELHDLVYRGDNNQYRLLIGDLQVADQIFPLGGRRGSTVPIQFLGGTAPAGISLPVELSAVTTGDVRGVTLPGGPQVSPFPIAFAVGEAEELAEALTPDGKPQPAPMPAIINGRLAAKGEQDRYAIAVAPGSKLRFFVQSEQLGSPLDAVLELRNEAGAVLITQDDGPGTADPDFFFTVPAGVASLIVGLTDAHRRGGEPFAYRLGIEPAPQGDFELTLLTPLINLPAGGSASVRIRAVRRDFNEPIRLKLAGDVPPGLQLAGDEIRVGATETLLSLRAPADAPLRAARFEILGEAGQAGSPVLVRAAKLAKQPMHEGSPWFQRSFAGAVTRPGLFTLEVEPGEPAFLRGIEYVAKIKVHRTEGQTGPINLAFQTSHVPLPGQVPLQPAANQSIAENSEEGVFKITVPPNATELPLNYVITGQLLDAKEKKAVVAAAEAPSIASRVTLPFVLEVTQAPPLQRGARNLVAAKLTRVGTFNQPIQVVLTGLPGNVRTGPIVVPPGISDFQIPLALSPAQTAGPLANLKLTGTWASAPPLASTPLDVPLTVAATDPPAFLEIFEDGSDFAAALTEGNGMATLETADVYAGKESVLVKPEQKLRGVLPGLSVPIAENPAPGQYRYLRFAWKKQGGAGIMLQLAQNGQFGVASSKGTDFRYVAGQDKDSSKAIRVADQPPAEWTVVTRDLFADHGPLNLTGLALTPMDGEAGLFDHIYLARTEADFPPPPAK